MTDTFNNNVDIHNNNVKSSLKLINSQNDDTTPTHSVNVNITTVHLEIRSLINKLLKIMMRYYGHQFLIIVVH